jgi:glycosyltransferase involved in cell wall biosynthesis
MGRIWDEAKNTKLLMDASPAIEVPVRIAGEERFAQNSVFVNGRNVHFLGKLSTAEIAGELAVAAIYVLPAKYEPFGLSALEAALSGCALVLGDIPTLREIWGEAAIYIDTNDAPALADVINGLLKQPVVRKEWGEKAKRRAAAFSTEEMVYKYWQLYGKVVKEKNALRKEEIV